LKPACTIVSPSHVETPPPRIFFLQAGTLQAIRIFASNPKWIPLARPCESNPARAAYKQRLALLESL
jgi:hypothetical protein